MRHFSMGVSPKHCQHLWYCPLETLICLKWDGEVLPFGEQPGADEREGLMMSTGEGNRGIEWLNPLDPLTSFLCHTQSLKGDFYSTKAFGLMKSFIQKSLITLVALCHRVRLSKDHTLPLGTSVLVTMLKFHEPSMYLVTKPQSLSHYLGVHDP